MDTTWVVIADEGRARILELREPGTELAEVEEITDAAAHAHDADLRRDAFGRRGGGERGDSVGRPGGTVTASAAEGDDKLAQEAESFARRIAQRLREWHGRGRFEHLRIAAAPKFLGRLRKALEPEVAKTVDETFDKDWLQLSPRELTPKVFHDAHHA